MANYQKYTVAYKGFYGLQIVLQGVRNEIAHSKEYAFDRVKSDVHRWNKNVDRVELVLVSVV
jgi:hypothetical protein